MECNLGAQHQPAVIAIACSSSSSQISNSAIAARVGRLENQSLSLDFPTSRNCFNIF
jgi:hypothetical protein